MEPSPNPYPAAWVVHDIRRDWRRWCRAERIGAVAIGFALFGATTAMLVAVHSA